MFIFGAILGFVAIALIVLSFKLKVSDGYGRDTKVPNVIARVVAGVLAALMALFMFLGSSYTQQAGEAKVLKDWTGNVIGEPDTTTGLSFKPFYVDTVDFDITNNLVAYVGNGETTYNGQKADGPQITFTDKDGATANLDITVTYSLQPDATKDIFVKYQNQDNFKAKVITQDIRSVTREVPSKFTTLELLNNRDKLGKGIEDALEAKWKGKGIIVDNVSLQEVRYDEKVKNQFSAAQTARIANEQAKAELETAKINAQQKVVQAEAEANANAKLAASLTEPILRQRYIDALSKAQYMVVPDGSSPLITVPVK